MALQIVNNKEKEIRANNHNNSMSIAQNKRKLNIDEDKNNHEPSQKRMRCDENNINNKLNTFIKSNRSLKEEYNQLTNETNRYKKEANKWKSKYMQLYSKISDIKEIDSDDSECSTSMSISPTQPIPIQTNNTSNDNYDSIRGRLLQMGFDKNQVINGISAYNGSGQTSQFVFKQLIQTFAADSPAPVDKSDIDSDENNSEQPATLCFEDAYYMSVNCHVCRKHFSKIAVYRAHLKAHYITDLTKTWMQCDFGCDMIPQHSMHFIGHIATHTNDKPYKCKAVTDGIKCDVSTAYKSDLKKHWTALHINRKKENSDDKKEEAQPSEILFEESYYVSVHCHVCKKHFDDFIQYRKHIQRHYQSDPGKTWLHCDFPLCDPNYLFSSCIYFISHLAQHTNDKPFKCKIVADGVKCQSAIGTRSNMAKHFRKMHGPQQKQKITLTVRENVKNVGFEQSYYVSVNCHVCSEHFDDVYLYRAHMKEHYDADPNKTWYECDFGCGPSKVFSSGHAFMYHIASHTKNYPYRCNVIVGGEQCQHSAGNVGNLKKHWILIHNVGNMNVFERAKRKCCKKKGGQSDSLMESDYESLSSYYSETESETQSDAIYDIT